MTNGEMISFSELSLSVSRTKKKKKYKFIESIIITKSTSLTVELMTFLDTDRSMT